MQSQQQQSMQPQQPQQQQSMQSQQQQLSQIPLSTMSSAGGASFMLHSRSQSAAVDTIPVTSPTVQQQQQQQQQSMSSNVYASPTPLTTNLRPASPMQQHTGSLIPMTSPSNQVSSHFSNF